MQTLCLCAHFAGKYLYLLFDDDNFAQSDNIVFTTEGHPLPLMYDLQKQFGDTSEYYQDLDVETRRLIERTFRGQKTKEVKKGWIRAATDEDATRHQNRPDAVKDNRANAGDDDEEVEACPFYHHRVFSDFDLAVVQQQLRLKQEQRRREEARRELQRQQCSETGSTFKQGDFSVEVGDGSFHVTREVEAVWDSGSKGSSATTAQTGRAGSVGLGDRGRTKAEYVGVFHLGSKMVEVVNKLKHQSTIAVIDDVKQGVIHYQLLLDEPSTCATSNNRGLFPSVGAFFGPTVDEFLDRRSRSGRAKGAPGGDGKGDRWDTSDDLEGEREEAEAEAEEAEEEDNDNSASSGASVQAAHQHPRLTREFHLHGQLVLIADEDERVGCSPFSPAVRRSIKGNLVYIERGVCTFMQKALHAQQAGAVGVVMANTQTRDLFVMGQDGSGREVTIPTVMIDRHKSNLFKLCMQKKALMVEKRNKKEAVEGSAVNKQDRGAGGGEKRTTETQQDVTLSVSIIQTTVPLYHGQGEPSRHQPDLHSSVDPRRQEKLLSVYGNKEKFTVTAAGKWKALVEKQERDYVLKLL